MAVMYLTADKIGPASGIEYGKKGTVVEVLNRDGDLWLVSANGIRFHVHPEELSEEKVEKEVTTPSPVGRGTKKKK